MRFRKENISKKKLFKHTEGKQLFDSSTLGGFGLERKVPKVPPEKEHMIDYIVHLRFDITFLKSLNDDTSTKNKDKLLKYFLIKSKDEKLVKSFINPKFQRAVNSFEHKGEYQYEFITETKTTDNHKFSKTSPGPNMICEIMELLITTFKTNIVRIFGIGQDFGDFYECINSPQYTLLHSREFSNKTDDELIKIDRKEFKRSTGQGLEEDWYL